MRGVISTAALAAATAAAMIAAQAAAAPLQAAVTVHADQPGPVYDRRIFSQFAEHLGTGIYGGLWVGPASPIANTRGFRNDVVAALREIGVPVVRWPGGCFADEYHWRDGIGPAAQRPVRINTHWGGVTEPNTVGTHEFMDLAGQLGAEPYVAGNVGNGTPQEMAEWVEYMTAAAGSLADERARNGHPAPWAVPLFGIGNELWGCGGNMRPEYAADLTRRYATFVKPPHGTRLMKIASGANVDDYAWTETMMREAAKQIDAVSLHYYTVPGGWPPRAPSTGFDESAWAETLALTWRMDELIAHHSAIMDKYDPEKRVALAVDEWGTWYAADPGTEPGFLRQGNTLRDALVAAVNLDIFARHADRVRLTAIAQMVNVLQAMILTDGPRMVRTPTYYTFLLYRPYMGGTVLPVDIRAAEYVYGKWMMPAVSGSAVRGADGMVHVALTNVDPNRPVAVVATVAGASDGPVRAQVLTASTIDARNSFDAPGTVTPQAFAGIRADRGEMRVTLPPRSLVMMTLPAAR